MDLSGPTHSWSSESSLNLPMDLSSKGMTQHTSTSCNLSTKVQSSGKLAETSDVVKEQTTTVSNNHGVVETSDQPAPLPDLGMLFGWLDKHDDAAAGSNAGHVSSCMSILCTSSSSSSGASSSISSSSDSESSWCVDSSDSNDSTF